MPKQINQKRKRYDEHEEKLQSAIADVKSNPEAKLSHVAVHYGINRKTLYNVRHAKTSVHISE